VLETAATASVIVWAQTPQRVGLIHTGPFEPTDRAALEGMFEVSDAPHTAARPEVLHDVSAIGELDPEAFAFLEQFVASNADRLPRRVKRLAVVRPAGIAGAAVTGVFHQWIAPRVEARLCTTRIEAYEYLDIPEAERAEIDAVTPVHGSPVLRAFREALLRDVRAATLARAAASVSISSRSLQRLLAANGTTFRRELARARIRIAEGILLDRADKLEAVARELGFSSASNFSTMFARATGEPPSVYRERLRKSRRDPREER